MNAALNAHPCSLDTLKPRWVLSARWLLPAPTSGHPAVVDHHKVIVAKANGSGEFGQTLTNLSYLGPAVGLCPVVHRDRCFRYGASRTGPV